MISPRQKSPECTHNSGLQKAEMEMGQTHSCWAQTAILEENVCAGEGSAGEVAEYTGKGAGRADAPSQLPDLGG